MSDVDPNARLSDLLRRAMATKAFGIAADLSVADALAAGLRSVAELGAHVCSQPNRSSPPVTIRTARSGSIS